MRRTTMNVFFILRQREHGLKCNIRANIKAMKSLVCKKGSTFKQIWRQSSKQAIAYEDGRIYFDNYRKCYATYGKGGVPQLLFESPRDPSAQKVEEGLICHCRLAELPLEHRGCRPHFMALHAHNWLVRYDLLTGKVLQKVFLSKDCKFRSLSWDLDQTRFVVKSKLNLKHRRGGIAHQNQNRLVTLGLFSVFPLEFIGLIIVTRSVFGDDIVDALIAMGMLIVMHQNRYVRLYSLTSILKAGLLFPAKLHEPCERAGGVVGTHPTGVPLNVQLKERPSVLFEVKCEGHNVNLGGNPWHYIISPPGSSGYVFNVYAVQDHREAARGSLCMGTIGVEQDKCFFHADNSGRILHIGQDEVRVLRLTPCDSGGNHQVELVFSVNAASLNKGHNTKTPQGDEVQYTSSGRAVRRSSSYGEAVDVHRQIVDVDYEDDIDLLAVTALDGNPDDQRTTVHLVDNQTGQKMAAVKLIEPWKDYLDHDVAVDLDTLVHIVRDKGQFQCYVYRLDRCPNDEENNTSNSKLSRQRKRTRRGEGFHSSDSTS